MADVFICSAVRTAVARARNGALSPGTHPVDLLSSVLRAVVDRIGLDAGRVQDVIGGCVTPINEQGANIPRLALLKAGFPVTVPGVQINRMCGSSQQAIHFASQAIAAGDMDVTIACGVEMMGTVTMGSDAGTLMTPEFVKGFPQKLLHQGVSAELVAEKYSITREQCDALAKASHEKAARFMGTPEYPRQIVPLTLADGRVFERDEGVRVPVDEAKLAALPTVFKKNGGVVTAGNASQVSDGAAAVLLCSERAATQLGLPKRARIVARVVVGSDPELMLDGVIPATRQALQQAGLRISDISLFEINEAFASVVLAWAKELRPDPSRVNVNGGAIAHGHPLGATGCILMTKLLHELERSGGRFGLQTMCIGHGQATCTIIENLSCRPRM